MRVKMQKPGETLWTVSSKGEAFAWRVGPEGELRRITAEEAFAEQEWRYPTAQADPLLTRYLQYPCTYCGAPEGAYCASRPSGRTFTTHRARYATYREAHPA